MQIHRNLISLGAFLSSGLLVLLLGAPSWAETDPKAELMLQKRDPYLYGSCGWCTDLLSLKENDNRKNLTGSNLDLQTGFYQVDLLGPAGTTVTLYGAQNYGLKRGYLILVKKDDRPIAVEDMDDLPSGQWVDLGTPETGIYSVWYHPASYFKERIASVRWGQWWTALPPASE